MHQDCRELNLVHILRIQPIDDTVGQSDGRNNNIGPVRFQLILLDTLFGRELSMFHIYLAVIFLFHFVSY